MTRRHGPVPLGVLDDRVLDRDTANRGALSSDQNPNVKARIARVYPTTDIRPDTAAEYGGSSRPSHLAALMERGHESAISTQS